MIRRHLRGLSALVGVTALWGCTELAPVSPEAEGASFAKGGFIPVDPDPTPAKLVQLIENINADFAARGAAVRIDAAWPLTIGVGSKPFRSLRTGAGWPFEVINYYLDDTDYTGDLAPGVVESTLVRSYETWNQVKRSALRTNRLVRAPGNYDIFDGWVAGPNSSCDSFVDLTAEVWSADFQSFFPTADIVVGGWMPGEWFEECFDNSAIVGITFSISYGDTNGDNVLDQVYVEQYYNDAFTWLTEGATFLGTEDEADLESIALHENGHALGLGHTGGPGMINNGLFKSGNFSIIFSPQAVMNGGYLGGESRTLYPVDEAAMRSLY